VVEKKLDQNVKLKSVGPGTQWPGCEIKVEAVTHFRSQPVCMQTTITAAEVRFVSLLLQIQCGLRST
jgi:hypothetical protein